MPTSAPPPRRSSSTAAPCAFAASFNPAATRAVILGGHRRHDRYRRQHRHLRARHRRHRRAHQERRRHPHPHRRQQLWRRHHHRRRNPPDRQWRHHRKPRRQHRQQCQPGVQSIGPDLLRRRDQRQRIADPGRAPARPSSPAPAAIPAAPSISAGTLQIGNGGNQRQHRPATSSTMARWRSTARTRSFSAASSAAPEGSVRKAAGR